MYGMGHSGRSTNPPNPDLDRWSSFFSECSISPLSEQELSWSGLNSRQLLRSNRRSGQPPSQVSPQTCGSCRTGKASSTS